MVYSLPFLWELANLSQYLSCSGDNECKERKIRKLIIDKKIQRDDTKECCPKCWLTVVRKGLKNQKQSFPFCPVPYDDVLKTVKICGTAKTSQQSDVLTKIF